MSTNGTIKIPEIEQPDTPASGYARMYVGTNKKLNVLGDDGVVRTVDNTRSIGIALDGGGSVLSTGNKGTLYVPYSGTITAWHILSDVSGSIVIDVWNGAFDQHPLDSGDSIAGSGKPTLSAAQRNSSTNLSGWGSTTVEAGDVITFNVDSVSTVTKVTLILTLRVS
jgi:hypothetical protein